jgi:hypothetical protein
MMKVYTSGSIVPTAFVTKGRQRVKQYNENVYLNNGDEFEIELFNPTSKKILAKITLNGVDPGSTGIVLRPGERVFLERYLDQPKKFLFETYEVDRNNPEVQKAIKSNGEVKVDFYEERDYSYYQYNTGYTFFDNHKDYTLYDVTCAYTGSVNSTLTSGVSSSNCYLSNANNMDAKKETGRVEMGQHSNQKFNESYDSFNSWPAYTSTWYILPVSEKAYTREELNVYCTNCGAKRKKSSFQFCPHCGNKF